ncbi:ATP-binding protein [Paenibacillus sepulcri]|uniref:histidine kinase n=1 Tax=Paenibacillus sepulcri TaxID=359917 RepID=A0ABS7BY71_9BACL|nr:HAMP domain-containing histidine kinase [Paenibacillus sepulcri]
MKPILKRVLIALVLVTFLIPLISIVAVAGKEMKKQPFTIITSWDQKWGRGFASSDPSNTIKAADANTEGEWRQVHLADNNLSVHSRDDSSIMMNIKLPALGKHDGLYIDKFYANRIRIYESGHLIYTTDYDFVYDVNRILLPLSPQSSDKFIQIRAESDSERVGAASKIIVGDYQKLEESYVRENLFDLFLGCAFIFVSLIMMVTAIFLSRQQRKNWLSLSIMILSIGILMICYEPFLYTFYGQYGMLFVSSFDVALLLFLPSLISFFENMFGPGYYSIFSKLRKFQMAYSLFVMICLAIDLATDLRFHSIYFFFSVQVLGLIMVVHFLAIVISTIIYAVKGSKEALILSVGIGIFAVVGIGELLWFYLITEFYDFKFWRFGVVAFVCSLIILLGRKMAHTHNKTVQYSKELEIYSQKLQLSEKTEVISQLAASVAHEVRNPLQVSRGFLQLLQERSDNIREQGYMNLAIEELDRASVIITNYLSFAKPQLDTVEILNLSEQLKHVEGMLFPLADLQGGRLEIQVGPELYVTGNAGKLMQIFVNLIKNSIEATGEDGLIKLWAYEKKGTVFIHLEDNGEGMDEMMLARIGEPYLTNKSKGTGLGMMVTFQLIDHMGGELHFNSKKGLGTEAIIKLPSASAK